jgi:tripartite-type tricarboxylate transporter receptor subunit TctC
MIVPLNFQLIEEKRLPKVRLHRQGDNAMTKFRLKLWAPAIALFFTCGWAWAQAPAWPSKTVKIIVAAPPGVPPDVLARGVAQQLEGRLGQPVVVENRTGASQIVGAQACASAPADGHTFCVLLNDAVSLNPHLFKRLPYDPDKGLAPVAILAWPDSAIVVSSAAGPRTFKDVVDASRQRPHAFNFASFGNGSTAHLYLEWIRSQTGWDVTHVPYTSNPLQPVLAGQVQLTYLAIGALKPHIEAGRVVPIAVAGLQRSPFLPDVPTFGELGLGNFFVRTWFGLFAPGGTPPAVIDTMNRFAVQIVNDPAFKSRVMDPMTLGAGRETAAEMALHISKDRELGGELVRTAKVKLD